MKDKLKYIITGFVFATLFGFLYSTYGMDMVMIAGITIIVTNQNKDE